MDELHKSLARLANNIGPEVLSIPLTLDPYAKYVAYTNVKGVWVNSDVADKEPQNIEVYLAHEIMHWVVNDPERTSRFPPHIVNWAEDFKINQLIEELWSYNVRKVGRKGLRNRKYDSLSITQIARILEKESKLKPDAQKHYDHYSQGLPCPQLIRAAERVKERYKLGRKPHFVLDPFDKQFYMDSLHANLQQTVRLKHLNNVDVQAATAGVWSHLYLERATHDMSHKSKCLRPSQALSYCFDADHFRAHTKGDAVHSAIVTGAILKALDDDALHIMRLRLKTERLKERILIELSMRTTKRRRKKFKRVKSIELRRRVANLTRRLRKIEDTVPLDSLLKTDKIVVKSGKKVVTPSIRTAMRQEIIGKTVLPRYVKCPLSNRIKVVSRRALRKVESWKEANGQVQSQLGSLLGDPPIPDADNPSAQESIVPECPQIPFPRDFPKQDDVADDEQDQDGSPSSGQGLSNQDGPRSATREVIAQGGQDGGGQGLGGGDLIGAELTQQQLVFQHSTRLRYIIEVMNEVESLLSTRPNRKPEDNPSLPLSMGYGDDLDNVDASEYALLANPETAMDFYVRLSQGSLLQRQPLQNKQSAVVLAIDSSGSMMGGRLETAIGFSLALANKLVKQKRGMALVLFHDHVYRTVDFGTKPTLQQLLAVFDRVESGGTRFQPPVEAAFDLRDKNKWKETTTILVTDGESSFDDIPALRKRKTRKDILQAILIGGAKMGEEEDEALFDLVSRTSKKGMLVSLIDMVRKVV